MSEEKNTELTLNQPVAQMIRELVRLRKNTWDWVEQTHTLQETIDRQKELEAMSHDLANYQLAILEKHTETPILDKELNADLKIVEIAHGYLSQIEETLKRDYEAKKKESGENKIDVVKNAAFLIATPAAFVAGVKSVMNEKHKKPSDKWFLLMAFAARGPSLSKNDIEKLYGSTNRKAHDQQKSHLSEVLKSFFGIDEEPIPFSRKNKVYQPELILKQDNCDLEDWLNEARE
jgi:hypothetical protein